MRARLPLGMVLICTICALSAPRSARAQADPVFDFIVLADSLARTEGEDALREVVTEQEALVGAAVGELLDIALTLDDPNLVAENVDFAERLAVLHEASTGEAGPLDRVRSQRGWSAGIQAERARGKELERQSGERRAAGELDAAVRLLEEAQAIYESIGDLRSEAVVWGSLGVAHWYRADWESVERSYRRALELRRTIDDRILVGHTLNGLGSVHYLTDRQQEALEFYRQAVELRRATGDRGGLATSLTYLGNCHVALGQLVEGRRRYDEALAVLGELEGNDRKRLELEHSLAVLYQEMGRTGEAFASYGRVLELARATDDPAGERTALLNLALLHRTIGEYRESQQSLDRVEELLAGDPYPPDRFMLHREQAWLALVLGERERARDELRAALRLAEEMDDPSGRVEALLLLGQLYAELGALPQALERAEQAREAAQEIEDPRIHRNIDRLIGHIHESAGDFALALESYARGRDRDREAGLQDSYAADELYCANALSGMGRAEEARAGFRRVRELARSGDHDDLPCFADLGIGDSYERSHPDSAAYYYTLALDGLESLREEAGGAAARSGFLSSFGRVYEEIARYYAGMERGEPGRGWSERAFRVTERARARGLLQLIRRSAERRTSPERTALLDRLYELQAGSDTNREERRRLEEELLALDTGDLRTPVAQGLQPITLDRLREVLPTETVLLQYAVGDSASFVWAIDREGHQLQRIAPRAELQEAVRRLRDALARPGLADPALRNAARRLFTELLEPVLPRLQEARGLVIVPDDILHELPFELLLIEEPTEDEAWSELAWMGRRWAPVYAPSATFYHHLRGAPAASPGRELLALGAPPYDQLPPRPGERGLDPLPFSREEIEALQRVSGAPDEDVLIGAAAHETALKQALRESPPRVLHLAAHGLIDPIEPSLSCIALAPGPDGSDDGYLHTLEILELPLDTPLVVLSACESGRGRMERGEGVVGLSRAFLAAGARNLVVSLWPVADRSTARLMEAFYRSALGEGRPLPEALRAARLELLDDPATSHPFYWAPFVLMGSGG